MWGKLPGMRDNRPDFQFDENARGAGALGEARGIVAQDFVRAYVNEKWREAGEVRVKRGRERIAWIGVAEIIARGCRDVGADEHGAAAGVGSNGITGGGKIRPGRKERRGGRERMAGGAKSERAREVKTTASGLTGNHNAFRRVTRAKKRTVKGHGVIHSGGQPDPRPEGIGPSDNRGHM